MVNKRLRGVYFSAISQQVAPTVLNYHPKGTSYAVKAAKITWEERGVGRQMPQGQQRAFTESERLRQCMWAAIQKPIYRWNGVCDEGCNAAICLDVHPPSHPECDTVHLFQLLGEH